MKKNILLISRLFIGLFICAVGTVFTINAGIGLQPWDVFHQGISKLLNITMGQASIIVSIAIVLVDYITGEKIGWGTLSNMLLIGIFMDILMLNNVIPVFHNTILKLIMVLSGMILISFGTYMYIGAGLGSGPRDGLMVALTKKTKKSIILVRTSIEACALLVGFIMGGSVGVGTVIMMSLIGYFVQIVFKLFKFDVKGVEHRFIDEDIKRFRKALVSGNR